MRLRIAAWSSLLLWALPIAIGTARAEPIQISVRGDASCAAAPDILNLLARSTQVRRAEGGERARRVDLAFQTVPGGVLGQVEVTDLEGTISKRAFPAETCEQAVRAVVLVIALTLVAPEPAPPASEVPSQRTRAPEAEFAPSPPNAAQTYRALSWKLDFAVRGNGYAGVGPSPIAGVLGLVRVRPERVEMARPPLVPSFAVGVQRSFLNTGQVDLHGSQAEIGASLLAGRVEMCALSVSFGAAEFEPCSWLELGAIEAIARSEALLPTATSKKGFWGGLGLFAHARVKVGAGVSVEAGVGGAIPFERYHFDFRDSRGPSPNVISPFKTAPVTGLMELGIAWTPK